MVNKHIQEGYIAIWVEGIDSFIINSHGFNFRSLSEINNQIKEPEEFEGVESGIYVFNPQFNKCEKDPSNGRITVPSYWGLEEDEYCRNKTKELRKEMKEIMSR